MRKFKVEAKEIVSTETGIRKFKVKAEQIGIEKFKVKAKEEK